MRLRDCVLAASFSVAVASLAMADVTGKVTLTGKAPAAKEIDMSGVKECNALHPDPITEETVVANAKGELANVVISVKTDDPEALGGAVPTTPAVLDQKGCQYVPHVLPMMVGQKLLIKNDDAFAHNVHSLPQTNPMFNFMQPNKDAGKEPPASPKVAEIIKVKCDIHPWMGAWLVVMQHPFFSVSKADGTFAIKGLPDGDYTLEAWHEKYGKSEQKVSVKGGNAAVNFTFKGESAMGPSISDALAYMADVKLPIADVKPIMASASGASAAHCDTCDAAAPAATVAAK